MISTHTISPQQWAVYKEARLKALKDSPDAFGSTWQAESARSDESWFNQVSGAFSGSTDRGIFAFKDAHVCGLVWCQLSMAQPGIANLYQMWVDPQARGCGIGRTLLNEATAWAQNKGATHIRLTVTVAQSPAMQLYRSYGFYPVGEPTAMRDGSELMVQTMEVALVHGV
ncbi:GNAT family N-acetyltransferase [Lampropedia aestuarii]|uniref:GNAT family N-acetyltransferase n=1 Tax=Lampropedia aestuarii TaxID=2562762 RepID=A0A4S5C052_9BURK|nr:GNAT family N-acetyltransferase [Lampropedia aestuarii]THJ35726.1 GNAT family N-acetyltransferase [Lampropedia aestuarii]